MNVNVFYLENQTQIDIHSNEKMGRIEEKILQQLQLIIYQIEHIKIIMENNTEIIIGSESCSFYMTWNEIIDEYGETEVRCIFVVDRRRDENGCVIKENRILDEYVRYQQEEDNQRYLEELRNENLRNENSYILPETNIPSSFYTNLFQSILSRPIILQQNTRTQPISLNQNIERQINEMDSIIQRYMNRVSTETEPDEEIDEISETSEEVQRLEEEETKEDNPISNQRIYSATFEIPITSSITNSILTNYLTNLLSNTTFNHLPTGNIQNPFSTYEDIKMIISEDEFENLTYDEYKNCSEDHKKIKECTICTDTFSEDDIVLCTICKHVFHKNCIKQWLCHESVKCPICREEICRGHPNF
jgi:hypothetical protein